jgi:hypothetical protein
MINIAAAVGLDNSPAYRSLNNIQKLLNGMMKIRLADFKQEERDRKEEILLRKREIKDHQELIKQEEEAEKESKKVAETEDGAFIGALLGAGVLLGGVTMLGGLGARLKEFLGDIGENVTGFLSGDDEDSEDSPSPSSSAQPETAPAAGGGNIEPTENEGGGSRLNKSQIKTLAEGAGFSPSVSKLMAAIAMAESGGDPKIDTKKSGLDPSARNEYSIGLWQINYKAHKPMLDEMGISENQLRDPKTNAKVAKKIYDMQGLNAWGAYTNGSYRKHLQQGGPVSMNPRFSPVLKSPPTITIPSYGYQIGGQTPNVNNVSRVGLQTGGSIGKSGANNKRLTGNYKIAHDKIKSNFPQAKPYHIAAAMGNFDTEAPGLKPNTYQMNGGPGRGIAQWEVDTPGKLKKGIPGRWEYGEKKYGKGLINSLPKQLDYFSFEMKTGNPTVAETRKGHKIGGGNPLLPKGRNAPQMWLGAKDLPSATKGFMLGYEAPGKPHWDKRLKAAQGIHKQIQQEPTKKRGAAPQKKQGGGHVGKQKGGKIFPTPSESMTMLTSKYDKEFYTRKASSVQAPTVMVVNSSSGDTMAVPPTSPERPVSPSSDSANYYSYAKMYSNYCRAIKV